MAEIGITRVEGRTFNWSAAVWAGLIGGVVFMVLEMVGVTAFLGGSPWGPPRLISAIVMGKGVLPPPATFAAGVVLVGMMIHFVFSIIFGIIIAAIVGRMSFASALGVGAVCGLVLYLINFYLLTAIFPWFAMSRTWVTAVTHILFGLAVAWAYMGLTHRTSPEVAR